MNLPQAVVHLHLAAPSLHPTRLTVTRLLHPWKLHLLCLFLVKCASLYVASVTFNTSDVATHNLPVTVSLGQVVPCSWAPCC